MIAFGVYSSGKAIPLVWKCLFISFMSFNIFNHRCQTYIQWNPSPYAYVQNLNHAE